MRCGYRCPATLIATTERTLGLRLPREMGVPVIISVVVFMGVVTLTIPGSAGVLIREMEVEPNVPCKPNQFECERGACIDIISKCNAIIDCANGFDEEPAVCSAPNATLYLWDTVTASLSMGKKNNGAIMFLLCNQSDCSVLIVWNSIHKYGYVRFVTRNNCNLEGWNCSASSAVESKLPSQTSWFSKGEVFEIEHREFDLAVWPEGSPQDRRVVSVPQSHTRLRIKPLKWLTNIDVDFSHVTIIHDNDMRLFTFNCTTGKVHFVIMVCNRTSCSTLSMLGSTSTANMFDCWQNDGCDKRGINCQRSNLTQIQVLSPVGFWSCPVYLELMVERQDLRIALWRQSMPEQKLYFPISRNFDTLRVRPGGMSPAAAVYLGVPCKPNQFECERGACIDIISKCNAVIDCANGFDEEPAVCSGKWSITGGCTTTGDGPSAFTGTFTLTLFAAPNATLYLWDTVTASLSMGKKNNGSVMFLLCNQSNCSVLIVWNSIHKDGYVKFVTRNNCNLEGWNCSASSAVEIKWASQTSWFSKGEVFEIEHREFDLAVWPEGSPQDRRVVSVPQSHTRLRIKPVKWLADFDVDFSRLRGNPVGHINCGQRTPPMTALLRGGQTVANASEFPWHVIVYWKNGIKPSEICGGSLISPKYFVSAGHCYSQPSAMGRALMANRFLAVVGTVQLAWDGNRDLADIVELEWVRIHELYNGKKDGFTHDIALSKLAKDVVFRPSIRPICIDWDMVNTPLNVQDDIVIVGQDSAHKLVHSNYIFRPYDKCGVNNVASQVTLNDKICVKSKRTGVTLTPGDSGGGLTVLRSNRWFLAGVVSINVVDHSFGTNVPTYTDWLRDQIRKQ